MSGEAPARPRAVRWALERFPSACRSALFFLPVYLLGQQLATLAGAGLWLPQGMLPLVVMLEVGLGVTIFHVARLKVASTEPGRPPAEDGRRARRRRRLFRRERTAADLRANRVGLAWWLVTALLFSALLTLSSVCLVPWQPDDRWLYSMYGPTQTDPELEPTGEEELRAAAAGLVSHVEAPFFLLNADEVLAAETGPGTWRGLVLFPLGFPWSREVEAYMEDFVAGNPDIRATAPRSRVLAEAPLEVKGFLTGKESVPTQLTLALLLLLHLGVVASFSAAFGFTFSLAEELLCG